MIADFRGRGQAMFLVSSVKKLRFSGTAPEKWPLRGNSPGYNGSHYQAIHQDEVHKLLQALKIRA